jgi:hypothetical protein
LDDTSGEVVRGERSEAEGEEGKKLRELELLLEVVEGLVLLETWMLSRETRRDRFNMAGLATMAAEALGRF